MDSRTPFRTRGNAASVGRPDQGTERDGALIPAIDLPLNHILKPADTAELEMLPIMQWLCLELGRAAGFAAPDVTLIAMPEGMVPALVVQRFDIRQGPR